MPKAGPRPANYREDVAAVVSRLVGRSPNVREKMGVSGRPQFFAADHLFAFVAQEGVALKLPSDVITETIDGEDYLPFQMRNKPVLREWIRIVHADAAAYSKDAALFRKAIKFVAAAPARRAPTAPAARARAPRTPAR